MSHRRKTNYPEIEKLFDSLCYSRSIWDVWNDVLFMIAAALSNSIDCGERRELREKQYFQIVKKYNEEEQKTITKIFTSIVVYS